MPSFSGSDVPERGALEIGTYFQRNRLDGGSTYAKTHIVYWGVLSLKQNKSCGMSASILEIQQSIFGLLLKYDFNYSDIVLAHPWDFKQKHIYGIITRQNNKTQLMKGQWT